MSSAEEHVAYRGNCHCGQYRFEVLGPRILTPVVCSCLLSRKTAALWLEPKENGLTIVRDDGVLTVYESLSLKIQFCSSCGTSVLGEHTRGPLKGRLCVNIRSLQGVNPFDLKLESLGTGVDTPESAPEGRSNVQPSSSACHSLSCHCGSVHAELLVPPSALELKEDNCSSCSRIGYIGMYPTKDQVELHGEEHVFEYLYGRKFTGITFCRTCGVHVFSIVHGPPLIVFDKVPAERREAVMSVYRKNMEMQPLNVRALNGVDIESLDIQRTDEGTEGYALE